jgi:PAS domain S-box-containing protein
MSKVAINIKKEFKYKSRNDYMFILFKMFIVIKYESRFGETFMKYLYELNLNNKNQIINNVAGLCDMDANICSGCTEGELRDSIIHLISGTILDTVGYNSICTGKACNIDEGIIKSFQLSGVSIKFLIAILMHFRSSINKVIFQDIEDKNTLFEYLEENNKYFDSLELSLFYQWEAIEKYDVLLKKVFDFVPYGVFIQEGRYITYANAIGEGICGYKAEELKSKSIREIINPDFIQILQHNKATWDLSGETIKDRYECKIIDESGAEIWIDFSIGEIEINERKCMLGLAVDITEHRKVEEFKLRASESIKQLKEVVEMDKVKTEFFSNLSHELRTPLNVILGSLQLVDMYSVDTLDPIMEKTRKYHKIMRQNCYRLLRLVNNLVDLNKLDDGYMYVNMENHDIVGIVSKIAVSVTDYIENQGINFEYSSMTESKIIACDPDKIERIILNLLSNAIKFTDIGGKITCSVWDEDDKIFISVKDSGIGIAKEKQEMVFKRFVQIDKSLSRNHNGSGIGLSLAKSLVELHRGKIRLISDAGMGCEFIIELPINELTILEVANKESQYSSNNKIEAINIEFSDIYL